LLLVITSVYVYTHLRHLLYVFITI